MIKTLRKIWKSDWGKAALLGVGMVGYGAASRAGAFTDTWLPETSDITNFLAPTKGSSGFLADVQQFGADIVKWDMIYQLEVDLVGGREKKFNIDQVKYPQLVQRGI